MIMDVSFLCSKMISHTVAQMIPSYPRFSGIQQIFFRWLSVPWVLSTLNKMRVDEVILYCHILLCCCFYQEIIFSHLSDTSDHKLQYGLGIISAKPEWPVLLLVIIHAVVGVCSPSTQLTVNCYIRWLFFFLIIFSCITPYPVLWPKFIQGSEEIQYKNHLDFIL